ncbi:hypothetical protein HOLleu_07866 [Holothuria leucospilota]|uniref:Uncharacterized protein n=1 Tax=Holothuria leucospilota TaxID=206669 RepID=A0A9Q1CHT9_HOLLE|nr:hypothetical protein HOLleu_07866 [Holothuria leucospilota]
MATLRLASLWLRATNVDGSLPDRSSALSMRNTVLPVTALHRVPRRCADVQANR